MLFLSLMEAMHRNEGRQRKKRSKETDEMPDIVGGNTSIDAVVIVKTLRYRKSDRKRHRFRITGRAQSNASADKTIATSLMEE